MGTYSSVQGDEELRETLSRHFHDQHRLQLSPQELLITSGAQQAINLIAGIVLGPMDNVLVERPTYSVAMDIFAGPVHGLYQWRLHRRAMIWRRWRS